MDTQNERTQDTLNQYARQGRSFITRYYKMAGESWRDDPERFMLWFIALREGWRAATWRFNRQAMAHVMREDGAPIEVLDMLSNESLLAHHPLNTDRPKKLRRKRILKTEEEIYLDKLAKSSSEMAAFAALFLRVNPEIGLRPKEWAGARIESDTLIVQNAKNSHGRSTGETRTLIFCDESLQNDVARAFGMRDEFVSNYGTWEKIQDKLRIFLRNFSRIHGLPNINMYATRHQFSANIKSAGFSKREVADAMGHASDETAGAHYGKRRSGRGSALVSPVSNKQQVADECVLQRA